MMIRHDCDPTSCVHGGYHAAELQCASKPVRWGDFVSRFLARVADLSTRQ